MSRPKKPATNHVPESRIHVAPLESLILDQANVRRHPERNRATIRASLKEFGAGRSVVADKDGVIRAGNGTVEEAIGAGGFEALVVRPAPNQLVVVQRDDWTATQAVAYGIADNRSSDLSVNDDEALARVLKSLKEEAFPLDAVGYTIPEIDELTKTLTGGGGGAPDPGAQVDRADELLKKWQCKPGDLWVIPSKSVGGGEHRLLCGDSTKTEDVGRAMGREKAGLMNTDPPYGVNLDTRDRMKAAEAADGRRRPSVDRNDGAATVEADGLDGENLQAFLESVIRASIPHLGLNAAFYLWHPMLTQGTFFAAAAAADILIHRQIIWVKPSLLFGRGDYHWQHELCFYGWRKGNRPAFYGDRNQTTVWDLRHETSISEREHPTQKPVELFTRPILNHTKPGEAVYEPFAGSGSQYVAAEQTGRLCRGIEIAPKYVSVCLERLSGLGLEPHLNV